MLELLQSSPALAATAAGLLGLVIGSFLNVVIHRLPVMMERDWKNECSALFGKEQVEDEKFNLMVPRSRCPSCGHEISALENIPVISYVLLGGKCRGCKAPISIRYPSIELLSGIAAIVVVMEFSPGVAAGTALIFTWCLISLAAIDFDTQFLPDTITLPLLWLGIIVNYFETFVSLNDAVLGVIFGYLLLWFVFWAFKLATGKDGMGYGDFKLLAAIGAWLGWQMLPVVIVLSSIVGAFVGIALMLFAGHERTKPIPFGPYLAAAGWIAMLWGTEIVDRYLHGASAL